MPFTNNTQFKENPRLLAKSDGCLYYTPQGNEIIDGAAGLWCCNIGHNHDKIKSAIQAQMDEMMFAPSFNVSHPLGLIKVIEIHDHTHVHHIYNPYILFTALE